MNWLERAHDAHHHGRRLRVLGRHFAELLPRDARVLDVGCGDGLLTRLLADLRPDLSLRGVDVLVREGTHVPVDPFDGRVLPFAADAVDAVLLVDVLHHAEDPAGLLAEAARVAGRWLVLKDHTLRGVLAGPTLTFMDVVSNRRHGVKSPRCYWPLERWQRAFRELGLEVEEWRDHLELYPRWSRFLFERELHFAARLATRGAR